MPEQKDQLEQKNALPNETAPRKAIRLPVQLVPVNNSDQAVFANHAAINIVQGMVYLDFGFIEPLAFAQITRAVQDKTPLPKALRGKLAVRVAFGFDVMTKLQQQLQQAAARRRGPARLRSTENSQT